MSKKRKTTAMPPREGGIKTAAFYGRVSSTLQNVEQSIEEQYEQSKRWAAQNGYTIIDRWADEAVSGTREDRSQFNQMTAYGLSKSKPYDAIIFWNTSRMARNTLYALMIREKLESHGVRLVTLNMQLDEDDPEVSAILIPMMHAIDEVQSIRIGIDVKRAQRTKSENGEWVGSVPPLGYLVNKIPTENGRAFRTLEIDPKWGPIVLNIFEKYAEGTSANALRVALTQDGLTTKHGGFFTNSTLKRILKNEAYKGLLVRGRDSTNKYPTIWVNNAWPAIVSKELWDKVQRKIAERAPHQQGRETNRNHALTKFIRCHKCGAKMDAMTNLKKGVFYGYYICSNRRLPEPWHCDALGIPMKPLENRVLKLISSDILTAGHMEELITILESEQKNARRQQGTNLKRLEQQLEQNANEKNNLLMFIMRNNSTVNESMIAGQLAKLDNQKDQLLEAKIREEIELNKRTQTVNAKAQIKAYVENLREDLDTGDPIKIREVLTAFCDHITAEKGGHTTIHYSIPMPPEVGESRGNRPQPSNEQQFPSFGHASTMVLRQKKRSAALTLEKVARSRSDSSGRGTP